MAGVEVADRPNGVYVDSEASNVTFSLLFTTRDE